ncbi:MAG TPA: hypothetical protein VGJ86_16825, partial [Acidimicrobiales bacterium]
MIAQKPALSVALTGPNGYQRTVSRTLDTILPGDTIGYPFAWPDVLQPGDYSITATASAPGSAPAVRTVGAHLATALAGVPAPGVLTPAPSPTRHSGRGYPWAMVILVAIAGLGGGLLLGQRRSGPRPPAGEPVQVPAAEGPSRYSARR